jgi:hypothetical protein
MPKEETKAKQAAQQHKSKKAVAALQKIIKKNDKIIAVNAAIAAAIAKNTAKEIDLIAIIEQILKDQYSDRSNLTEVIGQIITDDFEKTAEGEQTLKIETAQKLGLFSLGFINAVANSFMGLPSAAILVGLDHLFTNPLAVAALTGPDKLLLIIIALVILAIFLKIAYNQNYVKPELGSEHLQHIYTVFAQYVCSEPPKKEILNTAIYNKYLAKSIRSIRSGSKAYRSLEIENPLLLAEQKFKTAAESYSFKILDDDNKDKVSSIMTNVNYITAFFISLLISYFLAIIITTSVFPILYIIPMVCTILVAQKIIKYYVTEHYKPKQHLTAKNEYYLALYRVMKEYRETQDHNIKQYINSVTDDPKIRAAITVYLRSYKQIMTSSNLNEQQLQKIDDAYIMLTHNNNQQYFTQIGGIFGTANAVLNGILCCAFGITGIVAVIGIFFPAFQISLGVTIVAAIALFLGGTIHSFRFTRRYMTAVFSDFGQTLDTIDVSDKKISYRQWLSILTQKIIINRKAIAISVFTSIALSVLGFIAIASLLLTLPISFGATVVVLAVTTLLNFIACVSVFTETLQSKEQNTKYLTDIQKGLPQVEQNKRQEIKSRINMHYGVGAIITLIAFAICVSPLISLTVVPAIFIAFITFFIIFIGSAILDFKNIKQHNQEIGDILNLRVRICIITLFGLAFGLSSGPTVAILVFSMIPATLMPMSAILTISTLAGAAIGTSLCYAYSLVYWNNAVKPATPKIAWESMDVTKAPAMANISQQPITEGSSGSELTSPASKLK